jgi:hypothetical protein
MRAQHMEDGTIAVSGTTRRELFNRIWAGIGWPERDPGYMCVVGERQDGRCHALWEKRGGLWELGDAALEAKDRFLVESILVDGRDAVATSYLRTLNGLCFFEGAKAQPSPAPIPVNVPRLTPPFAAGDTTATVVPVPERVVLNYRSALEKIRGLIVNGRLLIHEANCPRLVYTLRQPLEDLLNSPVMKGLVWVLTALADSAANGNLHLPEPAPWYTSPPRGGK